MRQVFSSTRLENVEGVARMLERAGIEIRITGGRSYKSGWGGRRTYNDSERGAQPAVWVVKSDDQPRARQLLRDAGLLESTSRASDSYVGPSLHQRPQVEKPATAQRRSLRAKVWLLVGIAVVIVLVFNLMRRQSTPPSPPEPPVAAETAPAAPVQRAAPVLPVTPSTARHTVETPPALGAVMIEAELRALRPAEACISLDGAPLPAAEFAALERPSIPLHNPDACGDGSAIATAIDVRGWTTDGSGRGTVEVATTSRAGDGTESTEVAAYEVARDGTEWKVSGPATPR